MAPDLRRSEAEGGRVDVSLVPINQMQALLLRQAQVPPSGHMAQSERLPPARVPSAPTEEYQEHCVFSCCRIIPWKEIGLSATITLFAEWNCLLRLALPILLTWQRSGQGTHDP